MAVLSFTDAEILAGPLRMTGRSNQVDLGMESVKLDVTSFDSGGWEESIGGLRTVMAEASGQYDAAPVETGALNFDAHLFAELGGATFPLTVCPTKADGSVAYIAPMDRGGLSLFGTVGDVAPWKSTMWGDGAVARGALIHPANVLRTAGGTGTAVQLGTVAAGRSLLVAIHVLALSGTTPSLAITVQRDDNAGFSSATTVTTTGAVTAPMASLTSVAGPITPDDRYRVTWTLSGTTPSARFAVAVGITN